MDCKGQEVNPDISGIGVRLSFYLQSFFLVILVDRSWQDAAGALWTFVFTSFALTVSAVVQAAQEQLSLFQALTVGNLVWMANFGTFLSLASYTRHRANMPQSDRHRSKVMTISISKVQYLATMQTFFSMALTLYVWSNVHTFGNQDDCAPSVRYIAFFGAEFPALGSGQWLGLVITALLLGLYTLLTLHELKTYRTHVRAAKLNARRDEENPPLANTSRSTTPRDLLSMHDTHIVTPEPALYQDWPSSRSSAHMECGGMSGLSFVAVSPSPLHPRRPRRSNTLSSRVDPMFLSLAFFHIIIFMYFVVNTEILLKRNPAADNSDGQWSFGQIFAIIVVVPPLLSVIEALQTHGVGTLYHHQYHNTSGHEVRTQKHNS